jgi:CheY-like chemotaxis protein
MKPVSCWLTTILPTCRCLRESLEGLGCKILVAKNGMAALAIVAKAHPDLILPDIMMPEMDGYGLTAEIRRLEAGTERLTPILAITASEFDLSADAAKERGFSGHMLKPLDPEVLQKKLADLRLELVAGKPLS